MKPLDEKEIEQLIKEILTYVGSVALMDKAAGALRQQADEIKRREAHRVEQTKLLIAAADRIQEAESKGGVITAIRLMEWEQRLEIFGEFCVHCGIEDPSCQCWNDE